MKQHRINIMKLGDRLLPISHNQHHITEARNTIPLHSPHQTHSLNEKGKHKKRGWCRMLPTSECDFDNLKIELSSANLDLIIEKTKLLR